MIADAFEDDAFAILRRAIPGTRLRRNSVGPRPGRGDRLVFKMRITPHWFDRNNRFWYRNDLPGGAKEFILVDAERGRAQPAFDHQKLAAALSKATGDRLTTADQLPFDEIDSSTARRPSDSASSR